MPRPRSILMQAAFIVLLGAAINLGVSLGLAWFRPEGNWATRTTPQALSGVGMPAWAVQRADVTGATALHRRVEQDGRWFPGAVRIPWWSRANTAPTPEEVERQVQTQGDWMVTEVAYGWPFKSFRYEHVWTTHPVGFSGRLYYFKEVRGGLILVQPPAGATSYRWRQSMHAMPLEPIGAGFAANALLFGFAVWLPFQVRRVLRLRFRRRRGLCGECGYDLRGHGSETIRCPECGAIERVTGPGAAQPRHDAP